MKVLLTGASNPLGRATVDALLARQHEVRLTWADRGQAAQEWPAQVELRPWDPTSEAGPAAQAAATGCDAVIHLGPGLDWNAADEAARDAHNSSDVEMDDVRRLMDVVAAAGVPRLIYALSTRAGRDEASCSGAAVAAEMLAARFPGRWLVIRAGLVYGPTDPVISQLLVTMRALPAVPMVVDGTQRLRPLWYEDFGHALAAGVELEEHTWRGRVELNGPQVVTYDELYERIARLIDRRPPRVPVPEFLATAGARLAEALKLPFPSPPPVGTAGPLDERRDHGGTEALALSRLFGVAPTSLDQGLLRLMNEQPEQLPSEGVGAIDLKQFGADIQGSPYDAAALMQLFQRNLAAIMPVPIGVEPGSSQTVITPGATLTMTMPMRGHVQVRVEEATATRVTFSTLRGHPLAGAVHFRTTDLESGVRFEVVTCDRAATPVDWLILTLGGARGQSANWRTVVQRVVELSEGTTTGIHMEARKLSGDAAASLDDLLGDVIEENRGTRTTAAHRAAPGRT